MSNPRYHHYTRSRRRHPSSPPFRTFLSPFPHNVARKKKKKTHFFFIRTDTQALDTVLY
jgi:hypothetical protein